MLDCSINESFVILKLQIKIKGRVYMGNKKEKKMEWIKRLKSEAPEHAKYEIWIPVIKKDEV